jgi:hypothetical protein
LLVLGCSSENLDYILGPMLFLRKFVLYCRSHSVLPEGRLILLVPCSCSESFGYTVGHMCSWNIGLYSWSHVVFFERSNYIFDPMIFFRKFVLCCWSHAVLLQRSDYFVGPMLFFYKGRIMLLVPCCSCRKVGLFCWSHVVLQKVKVNLPL